MTGVPIRRENVNTGTYRRKTMWGHSKKVATCKPRRSASEETNPANTLISDFQPPELGEQKCQLFKQPGL